MITTTNFRLDFLTQNNNGIISSSSILGNFFCCRAIQDNWNVYRTNQEKARRILGHREGANRSPRFMFMDHASLNKFRGLHG